MKRLITLVLLFAAVATASAQEIVKTSLNFGPLPAVG